MMPIERMRPEDFDAVFRLLARSFPAGERRDKAGQRALLADSAYQIDILRAPSGGVQALMASWDFGGFVFFEHFAVDPACRNGGIGGQMLDALLARFPGLCFEIYHDDRRIHVLHPNDYTRNHEHLTRAKTEEVKDFREVDLPIIKLLFEEEKPLLEQVRDFIVSQEWGKRYELIFSSDHLLELTRRGATKGGMILKLAKLLGVARKDIYCIGDHNNDIPMLEVSEIGFAPENAIPEVKEWGAHIVCHCKDGALADVVEILNHRY